MEPWLQMLQGDDRLQQENLVAALGFLWNSQEEVASSTIEPSLVSKKRDEQKHSVK